MSNYSSDLSSYFTTTSSISTYSDTLSAVSKKDSDNGTLDMTDFLQLMVAQFQNQSIDNTTDTSDMLNQLVQMSVVQAIAEITDASVMSYASSLVGKEVTVGQYDSAGNLTEIVGQVTGTGTFNGEQVIFVDGVSYRLNEIMAVGRLPEIDLAPETPETPEETPTVPDVPETPDETPSVPETPETPEENPETDLEENPNATPGTDPVE